LGQKPDNYFLLLQMLFSNKMLNGSIRLFYLQLYCALVKTVLRNTYWHGFLGRNTNFWELRRRNELWPLRRGKVVFATASRTEEHGFEFRHGVRFSNIVILLFETNYALLLGKINDYNIFYVATYTFKKMDWGLGSMLWLQFSMIFSAKKLALTLKTNVVIKFLQKLAVCSLKKAIFGQSFRRKYFKNHNRVCMYEHTCRYFA
jgi:hypothetical protein